VAVPAATLVTTPEGLIVATATLPLLHVPPPVVGSVKEIVDPAQKAVVPTMAPGPMMFTPRGKRIKQVLGSV